MSVVCSIVILYAKYLAKMLHIVRRRNKKCSKTGTKQRCFGPEQYQYLFWCCLCIAVKHYIVIYIYTMSQKKRATLFSIIALPFL